MFRERRFITKLFRVGAQAIRRRDGVSSVEFAIVGPVLLLIMFGTISFGSVLYTHNNMINAAREAARRMAVGDLNTTEAEAYATNYLANMGVTFTVDAQDPSLLDPDDVSVDISVPASDVALVNFPGIFDGRTLSVTVTMLRE